MLAKTHLLAQSPTTMAISSYAQETMCYIGQLLVFEEASDVINNFTGCGCNAKQIERVCHKYGNWVEQKQLEDIEVHAYEEVTPDEKDKLHYISVDGSMYLTREKEEGKKGSWKEIKLGRIFKAEDITQPSKNRGKLMDSNYVAHLGSSKDFLPKMEYRIENLNRKVFIADGATWIWNWVEDTYPKSTQIVDFFHAKEHLCEFAKNYFKGTKERELWIDKQSLVMLNKGIDPVIKALEALLGNRKIKQQLINYYKTHCKRMQYHVFRQQGLLIGSGAMESAHMDALQQRLKLSGQRSTLEGLQ